jgi:hypothetical protein
MIANTIYNIDSNNYTISLKSGATTTNLTAGYYTATQLAGEIDTKLKAEDVKYACTYSSTTKKMTISHTDTAFVIDWNTNAELAGMLGFAAVATSSATSHTSTSAIDLSRYRGILIDVQQASSRIMHGNKYMLGNLYIPLSVEYGKFLDYSEIEQYIYFPKPTKSLNIKLFSSSRTAISLQNEWEMFLESCEILPDINELNLDGYSLFH